MTLVIVDSVELEHIAATVELYADMLDSTDEDDDIETVYGYAEQFKQAASDLREIADYAKPAEGG